MLGTHIGNVSGIASWALAVTWAPRYGPGRADGCRGHKVTEYVLQLLAQGGVPWPLLLLLLLLALVRLGAATLMFVQRLQLLLRRRLRRRPLSRRCC